ncbi:hypothetical protein Tco_1039219, partial [Tanacetum coccineum]
MSFSKRPDSNVVCYTKPLDSLKHWNDHFFWVDSFACLASFRWHTGKNVSKDPYPKSTEFNTGHYATLVAHPAPFQKYLEPFLCLVGMSCNYTLDEDTYPRFLHDEDEGGCLLLRLICIFAFDLVFDYLLVCADMDLLAFIRTADPTKVKVGERQRAKDEQKILDSTVGRVVSLLPVAPDRSEDKLKASVDKLFDEGGSTEHGDSAAGGDDAAETGVVRIIDDETMAAEKPKRPRKKRQAVADARGSFHPPKKLRDDHGTSSGAAIVGKSSSAIKELLASSILNVEAGASAMPTLPFVTSSVSATLEREGDVLVDSVTGVNLRNIGPAERFVIPLDSSHHSSTNFTEDEVDSLVMSSVLVMTTATTVTSAVDPASVVKEKLVEPSSFFAGSSSAGGTDPITGDFSDLTGSDFLVGAIRTVIDPNVDLQKMIDEFAPPKFFASIRGMEHDQLFTEFNVGATRQMSLSAE